MNIYTYDFVSSIFKNSLAGELLEVKEAVDVEKVEGVTVLKDSDIVRLKELRRHIETYNEINDELRENEIKLDEVSNSIKELGVKLHEETKMIKWLLDELNISS